MKDYSKFIQSSYGFILNYEIVNKEILVYTAETKKGEPHRYPANNEWVSYIENRLENQYRLLLNNRDVIKGDYLKKTGKIVYGSTFAISGSVILGGLLCALIFLSSFPLVGFSITSLLIGLISVCVSGKIMSNKGKKFDEELDIIQTYLATRSDIEEVSKQDTNITRYSEKNVRDRLKANQQLKSKGTLDFAFNIDFMDKTKLKELKGILSRYLISKELQSEQKFIDPKEEKNDTKKKSLKKEKEDNLILDMNPVSWI